MLRLASRAAARPMAPLVKRSLATAAAAHVNDSKLHITLIMAKAKQKVTIPAMAGWTILEAAQHHGLLKHVVHADPSWDYNTFGEGPPSAEDHVVISKEYFDKIEASEPASYMEKNVLAMEIDDSLTPTSRLASCVTLTKELDGLTAIVPDNNPDLSNYEGCI